MPLCHQASIWLHSFWVLSSSEFFSSNWPSLSLRLPSRFPQSAPWTIVCYEPCPHSNRTQASSAVFPPAQAKRAPCLFCLPEKPETFLLRTSTVFLYSSMLNQKTQWYSSNPTFSDPKVHNTCWLGIDTWFLMLPESMAWDCISLDLAPCTY